MVSFKFSEQFDTISPYQDHEVKTVIKRVVENPQFIPVLNYLYEGKNFDHVFREKRESIWIAQRLWPNNYIAFDILNNTGKYLDQYSDEELKTYMEDMDRRKGEFEQFDASEFR